MQDTDPWNDTALPPDWSEIKVQFDREDPSKTIPLTWAQEMLQRWHASQPDRFKSKLADVVADWAVTKYSP